MRDNTDNCGKKWRRNYRKAWDSVPMYGDEWLKSLKTPEEVAHQALEAARKRLHETLAKQKVR